MNELSSSCMLLYILFGTFLYCCRAQGIIFMPPENITVCRDDNVTVSCGYDLFVALDIRWIINSSVFRSNELLNSGTYLPNDAVPNATSLTIISINDTTTVQCRIPLFPEVFSWVGTVAVLVPPMVAPNISEIVPLNSTSFTVSWTIIDPHHSYIITWTNLRTDMMCSMKVAENTNSYTVTGLSGMDNYDVIVTVYNSCGMMMSNRATVYDTQSVVLANILADDITSESFVVQWDVVNEIFPVTYTIKWYGEDGNNGTANVTTGPSYTVTGLTANTSYNVTVVAINTCCGAGLVSEVIVVTTNNKPATGPPPITAATSTIVTATTASTTAILPISTPGGCSAEGLDSNSVSTGVAVAACVVIFTVTLFVTAIITFVVTYICVKKKLTGITQHPSGKQSTNTIVYDTVSPPSQKSNKRGLEMQPNPAYGTSHKVVMDANPAYESYK